MGSAPIRIFLIDAAQELRTLEYSQRLAGRARNCMACGDGRSTGRALFECALEGGRVRWELRDWRPSRRRGG